VGFSTITRVPETAFTMESSAENAVRWRRQRKTPDPKPPEFLEERWKPTDVVWLVVSNVFYYHPEPWGNDSHFEEHIFQRG